MARIADQFDVVVGVDTHTDSHTAVLRLAARIERPSTVAEREPLVCSAAEVTCHHDGTWTITAYLENHETEADVSFDPTWTTIGTSRPFGITVAGQLSATGDGRVSKIGLRILGVPPSGRFHRVGDHPALTDRVLARDLQSRQQVRPDTRLLMPPEIEEIEEDDEGTTSR